MKNNVYRSAAGVTAFSTAEKALSFIYRIYLSRSIGAGGLGIYQICLTLFSVFLTAASGGIPVTVSRMMAKCSATGKPEERHSVVTAGIFGTLAFTLPCAAILLFAKNLYAPLFPDKNYADIFVILLPGLILTSVYAVIRGAFWGNKQFLPYSVIELLENAVMVICGIILIPNSVGAEGGAMAAIEAVLISYIFSFAVSLGWYLFRGGKLVNPKTEFKPLMLASLPVSAMRTSASLLNSCVSMFLPALLSLMCGYSSDEAMEIYGAVLGMSIPILFMPNSLIGSIAVVVAPELSENFYAGRYKLLRRDIERTVKSSALIATVLIPAAFVCGRDLGIFLYKNELSGEAIRLFSFMMLPMCISMITTTILNSMHREVKTLIYFFIGAMSMLLCIFTLTPIMGINAYMTGVALSFIVTAFLNIGLLKKICPDVSTGSYTLRSCIVCIFSCVFGQLFYNLIYGVNIFPRIITGGSVCAVFAVVAFYGCEMINMKPFKKLMKSRAK